MLSRIKNTVILSKALSFRGTRKGEPGIYSYRSLSAGRQGRIKSGMTILVVFLLLGAVFLHLSGKSLATWYDDPIELLPPPMVYVHASEGRVYGAGNFAYRQKITIGPSSTLATPEGYVLASWSRDYGAGNTGAEVYL